MPSTSYHAYLLRLWRDSESGSWRASLEAPGDPDIEYFASLHSLVTFLEALIEADNDQSPPTKTKEDKE